MWLHRRFSDYEFSSRQEVLADLSEGPVRMMKGQREVGRHDLRFCSGFRIPKSPMGDLILDSTKPRGRLTIRLCVNEGLTLA